MESNPGAMLTEIDGLKGRLEEAEETLRAIRAGEVDALVVSGTQGQHVFSRRGGEHVYRMLIEQISDGAATLDLEGTVLYANRRLAALLRTPLERIVGRSLLSFVAASDRRGFQDLLRQAGTQESHGDITLEANGSERIPVLVSFGSIVIDDRQMLCLSLTDITERKQFEAELRQAKVAAEEANQDLARKNARLCELNETAQRFVDDVSHEFRTPLTVIKEYALIIRDGLVGEVNDRQREYLDIVSMRVDDLGHMVDDMLDTSRLEAGLLGVHRCRCTVGQIFETVKPTLQRRADSRRIQLRLQSPDVSPIMYCDPEKIARVIINLTVNAIKFSQEEQYVEVRSEWQPGETSVRICVADQGPGIAPEHMSGLFKRFTQIDGSAPRGARGFGLGLSIAHELVHLNFGEISLESRVGHGTTFTFTLPTADTSPLLSRYWERVQQYREGLRFASLVRAICDAQSPRHLEELANFLQSQIRCTDLVLPASSKGWCLVLASNTSDLKAFLNRVTHAQSEASRNRLTNPLPEMRFEVVGSWRMPEEFETFRTRVEANVQPVACEVSGN